MNDFLHISIVMPAYNAADTIGEAIDSVLTQTMPHWELIVVDDGSTDETAAIAQGYAQQDGRIRFVQQANGGGGAARNMGIAQAHYDWLLFFDADDWLLPLFLEKMTAVLLQDSKLDGVHCGWHRVAQDGSWDKAHFGPDQPDLFPIFAERCAFMMHTCVVRRSLVTAVSGFDESLKSCQDWDFWQRVTRLGVQFAALPEALALYRTRPGSVSLKSEQLLRDGLRVIGQAYVPDHRFADSPYANGLLASEVAGARIRYACWPFGLILGSGEDARPFLSILANESYPELDPVHVAAYLFEAALLPRALGLDGWDVLWLEIGGLVSDFLTALEDHAQAPDLAQAAQRHLERLILENSDRERPCLVGETWSVAVEVTQPISQFLPPAGTAVCRFEVWLEGSYLGAIDISTAENITTELVMNEIALAFAWPILGRYFTYHLFPMLKMAEGEGDISLWRGSQHLAMVPPAESEAFWEYAWNKVGWLLFLQEVWRRPEWPNTYFYDETMIEPGEFPIEEIENKVTIRLRDALPNLVANASEVVVTLTVAGEPIVEVALPAPSGFIPAQRLRAALIQAADFDLCRAVVQHALLGRPLDEPTTLLDRLQAGAVGREPQL